MKHKNEYVKFKLIELLRFIALYYFDYNAISIYKNYEVYIW